MSNLFIDTSRCNKNSNIESSIKDKNNFLLKIGIIIDQIITIIIRIILDIG